MDDDLNLSPIELAVLSLTVFVVFFSPHSGVYTYQSRNGKAATAGCIAQNKGSRAGRDYQGEKPYHQAVEK